MSQKLEIRGVYRKRRRMSYRGKILHAEYWQYYMCFEPWRGNGINPQAISKELFEEFIYMGVERLPDQGEKT